MWRYDPYDDMASEEETEQEESIYEEEEESDTESPVIIKEKEIKVSISEVDKISEKLDEQFQSNFKTALDNMKVPIDVSVTNFPKWLYDLFKEERNKFLSLLNIYDESKLLQPDIFNINDENVDDIYDMIQDIGVDDTFVISAIEYAFKIRPKQAENLCSLLTKVTKNYKPSDNLLQEFRPLLIEKGIIKCDEIKSTPIEEGNIEKAIKDDDVNKFIKISSEPDFNIDKKIRISNDQSIFYVKSAFQVSYMQFMAYYGSVKCFKYAIMDGSYDESELNIYAVAGGNKEIIRLLENKGVSFERCLEVSIKYNRNDISNWLIQKYQCGYIELSDAVKFFNKHAFLFLIRNKISSSQKSVNDALLASANTGDLGIVKYLVEEFHADVNHSDYAADTSLHLASRKGHVKVVKILIDNNANLRKNKDGWTPLFNASISCSSDIMKILIENGADVNEKNRNHSENSILHYATQSQNIDAIKLLIENNADVNIRNSSKKTPLIISSSKGCLDMVKIFVENGADINLFDSTEYSSLNYASEKGYCNIVIFLVENGADIHHKNSYGQSSLCLASINGHIDVVKYLTEHDIDDFMKNFADPLCLASQNGHLEIVKYFIEKGVDVNKEDRKGGTPLFNAVKREKINVSKFLIEQGANVNARVGFANYSGETPLFRAIQTGNFDISKLLIENGANVNQKCCAGETPLYKAVRESNFAISKLLIEKGADVNYRTKDGSTLLHIATEHAHLNVIKLIIDSGVKVNQQDINGKTPLFNAIERRGSTDIVKLLIKSGAQVNIKSKDGCTPIRKAFDKYDNELVIVLAQNGADVNQMYNGEMSLLYYAAERGYTDIVKALVKNGAKINQVDKLNKTPLHIAIQKERESTAIALIESGANLNILSKSGYTPLSWAISKGMKNVAKSLVDHGADINQIHYGRKIPNNYFTDEIIKYISGKK